MQCNENGAGPDYGYMVRISSNGIKALIQEQTIAGPQNIATLACVKPQGNSSRAGNLEVILTCNEPKARDGGYSLLVTQDGSADMTTATLSKETLQGPRNLSNLTCQLK